MTDRSKFEQMLELLINEETDKAKELFHDIVVAKSREIYEELLAEDFEEDMDPAQAGAAPGQEMPADDMAAEVAGDETDDMLGDIEMDHDEGGEEGEAGDGVDLSGGEVEELQDRVVDLEDALDALRDEFESLMGGEEGHDMGGEEEPEMGGEEEPMDEYAFEKRDDEEEDDVDMDEAFIREYVEKVSAPKHGDNGVNTKSAVAGKNDMGGTTANIGKSFSTEKGGTQGGLLNPSTKDQTGGNINVPGGKAGVKHLKSVAKGHGAEKKGAGETAANTKPIIGQ